MMRILLLLLVSFPAVAQLEDADRTAPLQSHESGRIHIEQGQTDYAKSILNRLFAGMSLNELTETVGYEGRVKRKMGSGSKEVRVVEFWLDHGTILEAKLHGGNLKEWESQYSEPPPPIDPEELLAQIPPEFRGIKFFSQHMFVFDSEWGYVVGRGAYSKTARDSSFLYKPSPGNRFLTIPVSAINLTRRPMRTGTFKLLDENGKTFTYSNPPFISNGYWNYLSVANPEEIESGAIVFDVPDDRLYFLSLPGGKVAIPIYDIK